MRDAIALAAAVFEPEEVKILESALKLASAKLATAGLPRRPAIEIAKLVHNLARTRIVLKKPLHTDRHANEIADEVVEHYAYLEKAPEPVLAAARECAKSRAPERIIGAFPKAFRQPPVNRL